MCRVFSRLEPETYAGQTRSIRLGGHVTSIRLEASFWQVLEEIAEIEGMSLGRFLTSLHDEILALHGDVQNFTSLLRCCCLVYKDSQAGLGRGAAGTAFERGHGAIDRSFAALLEPDT